MANGDDALADEAGREFARLGKLLRHPQRYCERRVERLSFDRRRRADWRVTSEISIPRVDNDNFVAGARIVSLGFFPKERYPDLAARDGSGNVLPLLGRHERAHALASVFLADFGSEMTALPKKVARRVGIDVQDIIAALEDRARERFEGLKEFLKVEAPELVTSESPFRSRLEHLIVSTHILAVVVAAPGQRVVLEHTFSSPFQFTRELRNPMYTLTTMSLVPSVVELLNLNVGHVRSFHLIVKAPAGLSLEDLYWLDARYRDKAETQVKSPIRRGSELTLSAHVSQILVRPRTTQPDEHGNDADATAHRLTVLLERLRKPAGKLLSIATRQFGRIGPYPEERAAQRPADARLGVQVHPRGFVRFAWFSFLAMATILAGLTLLQEERFERDAVVAVIVVVPGFATALLSQEVTDATSRLAQLLRRGLLLGTSAALACATLTAFGLHGWPIAIAASMGAGYAIGASGAYGWCAMATRAPDNDKLFTGPGHVLWRRAQAGRAAAALQRYAIVGASTTLALLVVYAFVRWL